MYSQHKDHSRIDEEQIDDKNFTGDKVCVVSSKNPLLLYVPSNIYNKKKGLMKLKQFSVGLPTSTNNPQGVPQTIVLSSPQIDKIYKEDASGTQNFWAVPMTTIWGLPSVANQQIITQYTRQGLDFDQFQISTSQEYMNINFNDELGNTIVFNTPFTFELEFCGYKSLY